MQEALSKFGGFLLRHPFLIFVIILLFLFLIILIAVIADEDIVGSSGSGRRNCTYSLGGISSSGNVEISNVMVEIVNCDATKENYKVLETVEFEKYVLGVALAGALYVIVLFFDKQEKASMPKFAVEGATEVASEEEDLFND